jgi:rhodanese-related sulfurtransferase
MRLMDVSEARSLLRPGRSIRWVDVRSPAAFHKERIPGAISMPYPGANGATRLRGLIPDLNTVIVVYGDHDKDAIEVARSLESRFKDVRVLKGGLPAWQKADLNVESAVGHASVPRNVTPEN